MKSPKIIQQKKAYVHTLEAFLAFFATFAFLIFIVHSGYLPKAGGNDLGILLSLEKNTEFRDCIYVKNTTCLTNMVQSRITSDYQMKVTINELEPFSNNYDIHVEQLFVAGGTSRNFNIVKLYYWRPG